MAKARRKTWREKFDKRQAPIVKKLEKKFADINEGETMLISTPKEIQDFLINHTKPGESISIKDLRASLAKIHKADKTCPVTTGIFLRIISELAIEELKKGKDLHEVAPFWRVMEKDSVVSKKLSMSAEEFEKIKIKESRL